MVLGSLDKRACKSRCKACARRRIKCEGGSPCLYCRRRKFTCTPQSPASQSSLVFVQQDPGARETAGFTVDDEHPPPILCPNVRQDTISRFTNHFFTTFLVRNDFAGSSLDLDTIANEFQSTPSLYYAAIAVGAINLSCPNQSSIVHKGTARLEALKSYRASIIEFQKEIQSTGSTRSNPCLWTAFFLGLFELMFDTTGDGWVKHIFYGTSRILQIRGPDAHLTGRGRSFFFTVRLFEIGRSCFYPEPTFLSERSWTSFMDRIWEGDLAKEWHPKESLLDLMISCSTLSHRMATLLKPGPTQNQVSEEALLQLASEGVALRAALYSWRGSFKAWLSLDPAREDDPRSTLANIYFPAISIYLSGIFDYRYQFNHILSASIPSEDIQVHVQEILRYTEEALKTTNLVGLLFFFPLRVAGARARTLPQRSAILAMLDRISERGFVVAQAFSEDLKALWGV